jgi:hypothetical protein
MNMVDAVPFFFGDDEEVCRKTLSDALADERTADRLASLDPDRVLEAGRLLSQPERVKILELLALSLKDGPADERGHQIIELLGDRVAELDDDGREAVSAAIEAMVDEFAAYVPLVRADPSLLPAQVSAATLKWLKSATPASLARLVPRGRAERSFDFAAVLRQPPFEVLRAAVGVGAFEETKTLCWMPYRDSCSGSTAILRQRSRSPTSRCSWSRLSAAPTGARCSGWSL